MRKEKRADSKIEIFKGPAASHDPVADPTEAHSERTNKLSISHTWSAYSEIRYGMPICAALADLCSMALALSAAAR